MARGEKSRIDDRLCLHSLVRLERFVRLSVKRGWRLMSDLGILSHHYQASAELADELNEAVIALKRYFYDLPGKDGLKDEQLAEYRCKAAAIAEAILAELEMTLGQRETETRPERRIPASVVDRLRQRHRGDIVHFLDDLGRTVESFEQTGSSLRERDIQILEELSQTAGLDTAEVFRKMWRHG